ncbi:hypothetical protein JCM3774_004881 [Rhodotorula dairenensis]
MILAQLRTPIVRSVAVAPTRRWASMGRSSNRPIKDGANELGGDVKRNQSMIAVGGIGLVATVALWWKSAKTEDPLKPPMTGK